MLAWCLMLERAAHQGRSLIKIAFLLARLATSNWQTHDLGYWRSRVRVGAHKGGVGVGEHRPEGDPSKPVVMQLSNERVEPIALELLS